MNCPKCGHQEDKVIDSRGIREGAAVRRRRECMVCSHRFTTLEEVIPAELFVIKRDESREEIKPQKIRDGLWKACWKRPISEEQIDDVVARILQRLESLGEREIASETVGNMIMEELHQLDDVAYVRFASVYRQFKSVDQFIKEVRMLNRQKKSGD